MLTVRIERLSFNSCGFKPAAQRRCDLLLKRPAPPPQVNGRRKAFAGIHGNDVDFCSEPSAAPKLHGGWPQPLNVQDVARAGAELNAGIMDGYLRIGQGEKFLAVDGYGPDRFQCEKNS